MQKPVHAVEPDAGTEAVKSAVQNLADSSVPAIIVVDQCATHTHRDLEAIGIVLDDDQRSMIRCEVFDRHRDKRDDGESEDFWDEVNGLTNDLCDRILEIDSVLDQSERHRILILACREVTT